MTFAEHGLPLIVVAALWFGSTGLVLWLDSRPARTFGTSLALAGLAAMIALVAIALTRDSAAPAGAYIAFAAALVIWGWHELAFLTGVVTGPNRAALPTGVSGWGRFRAAAATLIHHELALMVTALLLALLTWGHVNPLGGLTFALLFALRLSAKLNIFLGVPAFVDEMLPAHLSYLRSYFRTRPMNPLFPVSLAAIGGAAAWLAAQALTGSGGAAIAASLLFALAALGVVEHLFLVLPFRDAALWRWARNGTAA